MDSSMFVKIRGVREYLWRAVDQHGNVLDILIQGKRDGKAATRFFTKILKKQGRRPRVLVTDKLPSYQVAHRKTMSATEHRHNTYVNNRCENYPSTDQATRTLHDRIPQRRLSPEVPDLVQPYLPALPTTATSDDCHRPPHRTRRPAQGAESGHRTGSRYLTDSSV
ncbi:DDE-type integrase/transposase/recombinase [Rhodococcus erythropolis]|uniref:DDE-type integrase/transposase/recombinase n=1 Tax=Rhodococcus erythropolis TaxID=1833 RepID=UPI00294A5FCC|nr:DDE-type integrase/transposase/recombinase [Rhodococcus erythropolis]MDV6278412.1 DDE-type integrase/transposase/recombinase [Rhodococcus erythropolis]